jgi:hypothetical protein
MARFQEPTTGVDRHWHIEGAGQLCQDWLDPRKFFVRYRSRSRRVYSGTDVDDVVHRQRVRKRRFDATKSCDASSMRVTTRADADLVEKTLRPAR